MISPTRATEPAFELLFPLSRASTALFVARAPGHYWTTRIGQPGPPQPGQWMNGAYWLIDGRAARDDEVIVHSDRLDPPDIDAAAQATPEWIREPVTPALATLHAALDEAQNAVRLHIATGGGSTGLARLVARRDLAEQASKALAAVLRPN